MGDDDASVVSSSRPTSPTEDDRSTLPPLRRSGAPAPYRFHWDPSIAKRQGPPSVSETTDLPSGLALDVGQGSSSSTRIESLFDAGAPSALPQSWSSTKHGFNAISTVLNSPHSRPNPLKSGKAPIFSGPSPDLPRIRRKDFDPYLKAMTPEWDRFERNRRSIDEASTSQSHMVSPDMNDHGEGGSRSMHGKKAAPSPPPLDTVPNIYFAPDFDLCNPRVFAAVVEQREEDLRNPQLVLDARVQDKLSQSLDTVEQHLTIEIQARSSSFFAALSNLHSLQAEGSGCMSRISRLRKELLEIDEQQAKRGLHITRLLKRSENLETVQEGVRTIQGLGESVGLVKNLVGTGEYFEALGLISQIETSFERPSPVMDAKPTTNGKPAPHVHSTPSFAPPSSTLPLSSLVSLNSLPSRLRELSASIATSLSADLVALLRADLSRDLHDATFASTPVDAALHERIFPLFQGLVSTSGVDAAVKSYQDVALAEIRSCVRKYLPPSEWDDEDLAAVGTAAANSDVKAMSHEDFLRTARTLYALLLARIHTVAAHVATITSLLPSTTSNSSSEGVTSSSSSEAFSSSSRTLSTLLSAVTELANARASKLVALRSQAHASLPLQSFLEIFQTSWSFVVESEVLARRMIVGLRGVVVGQAKGWLSAFHSQRITEGARAVEEEVWAQVEVGRQSQGIVDLIVRGAMEDPAEFVMSVEGVSAGGLANGGTSAGAATNGTAGSSNSSSSPASSKLLKIEDRTYFVVAATMQVLELLVDYLKVIVNLSLLTTDAMSRVIEFLKAFNSRTCQVVLGAGAMRSAGLKNITAKHLALASQALSVMIALIPYVREAFRRHLNPKQAVILVEFDKLKRDYQEHQNEIHAKLIAIMGDRLTVHCKSLQEIQWDVPSPGPGPNPYMEVLVKETVTLHKVLSKYLAPPAVELIMSQVFAAVTHKLSEEYGKIELPNQEAKTRLLQDAKYLHDKLSGLKNVSIPGSMLETVVMEKNIPRKGSPFPTRRPTTFTTINGDQLPRRSSTLGSPALPNGMGSPRSISAGSPVMQSLLTSGPGVASSSPTSTPSPNRGGRRTPTSPSSRSPYASPRLQAMELRPSSPGLSKPSSPLAEGAAPSSILQLALTTESGRDSGDLSQEHQEDKPPPTPEKDRKYLRGLEQNDGASLLDRGEETPILDDVDAANGDAVQPPATPAELAEV